MEGLAHEQLPLSKLAMSNWDEAFCADFETAMGEAFADSVVPPVAFEDASPHECCEAIHAALGEGVTPTRLARLAPAEIAALAEGFGAYFETGNPSAEQIERAVAGTLARWPAVDKPA